MKRLLPLMIALLFAFVGVINAQTVIDFETGDLSQLSLYDLQNDSDYPWQVVVKGSDNYCMQSGNAGLDGSVSSISITVNYPEYGHISFDANCMGEGGYYDVCEFLIDGNVEFSYGDNVYGWQYYGFNVAAGIHRFTWRYVKDESVNPDGDCFQVDNITIGSGDICISPSLIKAWSTPDSFYAEWDGTAMAYALRYKNGSGSWVMVNGITENSYHIDGLTTGYYTVEVQAECNPETWVSTMCMVCKPTYWNDWYGFANYSNNDDNCRKFVHFKFGDLSEVTAVSDKYDDNGNIYSATFVNGYVWYVRYEYITAQYNLYRAPVDMWNRTIGTPELIKEDFDAVVDMSYNAADGWVYYTEESEGYLKRINPENVNDIELCGIIGYPFAFAVNKEGQAYACFFDGGSGSYPLFMVNLSDATMTKVGELGYFLSDMAFDMLTGELLGVNGSSMYYIDPDNACVCYLGILEGEYFTEISGMFMTYPYNAVEEVEIEDVSVYPNPAQGYFTVEGTGKLTITNMLGQEILVREAEGKTMVELPQGMYLVRLNNAVSKVVVE